MRSMVSQYVVVHNVVPLRAKPSSDSEQVSQILMGQTLTSIKEENGWVWGEGEDTYRGWADKRWLIPETHLPLTSTTAVFSEFLSEPDKGASLKMRLPLLVSIYSTGQTKNGYAQALLPDGKSEGWIHQEALHPLPAVLPEAIGKQAANWGRQFLGTPYLWGGSSSFGLDCSGFVQLCYRLVGVTLRRDADIQREDPRFFPVEQTELHPGDLVFFGRTDRITHVGMHLADNTFIHSAGGAGVILTEWGDDRYSPGYVDARRLDANRAMEPVTRFEDDNR